MKQVDIQLSLGNAGQKTLPVFYAVENREAECMQIFRCTVGLPEAQIPQWLGSGEFELITHVRDGVQLVDYNHLLEHSKSYEADSFRYKVYTAIYFSELRRRRQHLPQC